MGLPPVRRFRPIDRLLAAAAAAAVAVTGCDRGEMERSAPDGAPAPWFVEITDGSGLDFAHESGATGAKLTPEVTGSGAGLFDCDGDGDLDAYLVNSSFLFGGGDADRSPTNRLFRQESGGHFVDATAESGLGDAGYGMGVAVGDYDNDGDLDVYVSNYGPDRLFQNDGEGTFRDVTGDAGIDVDGWSCSVAFFDYDRDGHLDLFVTRYLDFNPRKRCVDKTGRHDYCPPREFPPVVDVLLRNNGNGTFADVTVAAGITAAPAGAGLGLVCEDLDEDGWIDVYVANDDHPNHLWINQGDGTFRDMAIVLGAALDLYGIAQASMGVLAADFDGDTTLDLFLTHFSGEHNTLYRNLGNRRGFEDISGPSGVAGPSMSWTGFGTLAFDAELDGDLDLLVANGRTVRREPLPNVDVPAPWDQYAEPNQLFVNDGRGVFTDRPDLAPHFCEPIEISRGLASGDVDGDGDLDVLLSNTQGPARLYRNDAPRQGHWLLLRCRDERLRRDALGARVTVFCDDRPQVRTINTGFSYLSCHEPVAHFGLGAATRADRVVVAWPDGLVETFGPIEADRSVTLVRGTGE